MGSRHTVKLFCLMVESRQSFDSNASSSPKKDVYSVSPDLLDVGSILKSCFKHRLSGLNFYKFYRKKHVGNFVVKNLSNIGPG